MDGSSYTPFNLGLRHHAFGPYAPHLKAAKYTCKYQNILLFLSSLVTNNKKQQSKKSLNVIFKFTLQFLHVGLPFPQGFSMSTRLLLHVTKEFSPVRVPGSVML